MNLTKEQIKSIYKTIASSEIHFYVDYTAPDGKPKQIRVSKKREIYEIFDLKTQKIIGQSGVREDQRAKLFYEKIKKLYEERS